MGAKPRAYSPPTDVAPQLFQQDTSATSTPCKPKGDVDVPGTHHPTRTRWEHCLDHARQNFGWPPSEVLYCAPTRPALPLLRDQLPRPALRRLQHVFPLLRLLRLKRLQAPKLRRRPCDPPPGLAHVAITKSAYERLSRECQFPGPSSSPFPRAGQAIQREYAGDDTHVVLFTYCQQPLPLVLALLVLVLVLALVPEPTRLMLIQIGPKRRERARRRARAAAAPTTAAPDRRQRWQWHLVRPALRIPKRLCLLPAAHLQALVCEARLALLTPYALLTLLVLGDDEGKPLRYASAPWAWLALPFGTDVPEQQLAPLDLSKGLGPGKLGGAAERLPCAAESSIIILPAHAKHEVRAARRSTPSCPSPHPSHCIQTPP
ncbi:hypothetical protein B0H14DRAFT_3867297 [Mycena olivaceomarginata]|nr:hypothetical protein B0H14DRAFT_3867297 [Mycena olivaceomarginata]